MKLFDRQRTQIALYEVKSGTAMMSDMEIHTLKIGQLNARRSRRHFGIKGQDRLSHMYILGKTGTGKSTLLLTMIKQDIAAGRGCAVLDPHGDLVDELYRWVVQVGAEPHVTYVNVPDEEQPYGYNPIRRVAPHLRPLLASGMLEVFKKLWKEAWGVRMEHIFRNVLLTLLDLPRSDLSDIQRILVDKQFLMDAQKHITNPHVKKFWQMEFTKYSQRYRADAIAPIQNKIGGFLAHPTLCQVLLHPKQNLSLRSLMDNRQALLVNLAKGRLGEDASHRLGGLLMTSLGLAAFSRADIAQSLRVPFYLYADEFQNFTTLSLVNMTSELRKYRLGLILTHQYLLQLDPDIRSAVLGNAGTLLSFRIGAQDAVIVEKEFAPEFTQQDLLHLPNYDVYVKLMIDGMPSRPFSATTIAPDDVRGTQKM